MRIVSIHIDGFGNLKNADYVFTLGMNMKEIGTVWDRSAIAEFIIAMIFGLEGQQKIRAQYAPRDGSSFGGAMTVSAEGREYRIIRSFSLSDPAMDTLSLTSAADGIPMGFAPTYFLGVTRDQYVKNATIIDGTTFDDYSMHDRNLLMSLINAEEERTLSKRSLENLQRAETRLTRGGSRVTEEARYKEEQKQYELQEELKRCKQKSDEVKVLREQEAEALRTLDEKKAIMDEAEDKVSGAQNLRRQTTQHVLSLALALICLLGGLGLIFAGVIFRFEMPGSVNGFADTVYDGFLLLLFALFVFYFRRRWRRRQENKLDGLRSVADELRQEYESVLAVVNDLNEQIKEVSLDADRVGEASDALENFKTRVEQERRQLRVIRGARKYIQAATEEAGHESSRILEAFGRETPMLIVMDVFSDHALAREVFGRTSDRFQVIYLT
ncbi:MAG: hypothetical protein II966_00855 [Lachnospiraceae bacterium]|nr:hypothetical protein [Lachnospiraceae bacterium]